MAHRGNNNDDETIESANPTYTGPPLPAPHVAFDLPPDAQGGNHAGRAVLADGAHKSTKSEGHVSHKRSAGVEAAQKLHPGTTLDVHDWQMIEDRLLPFELTVITVSIGGVALIAITICFFTRDAVFTSALSDLMGGVGFYAVVPLLCVLPAIVGIAQIAISFCFGFAAAFENWADVSIQDVVRLIIRRHVSERLESYGEALPLHCTARRAYLLLMHIFIFFQLIVAASILGIINDFAAQANSGNVGSNSGNVHAILDFSTSVFDQCCASQGWTQMGSSYQCDPGQTTTSNCTLPSRYQPVASKLCVCYTATPEQHAQQMAYAESSGVCDLLKQASVQISDIDVIPGSTVSIRALIPPGFDSFPVVGNHTSTYGCGVGFIRGFQWAGTKFTVEIAQPYIVAILAITLFQMFCLILGTYMVCVRPAPNMTMDAFGNVLSPTTGEVRGNRAPLPPNHPLGPKPTPTMGLRSVIAHREAFKRAQAMPDNAVVLLSPSILGKPALRTKASQSTARIMSPVSLNAPALTSPEKLVLAAQPTSSAPPPPLPAGSRLSSPQMLAAAAKPSGAAALHQPQPAAGGKVPKAIDDVL